MLTNTDTGARDLDVIVLGGGLTALWAAYACGKAGHRTLLLDPEDALDATGSGAGAARAFHSAFGKEDLTHLAREAILRWKELDPGLVDASGVMLFGDLTYKDGPWGDSAQSFARLLGQGVQWTSLSVAQLVERYGFRALPARFMGSCFHGLSGAVNLSLSRRTLLEGARQLGVQRVAPARVRQLLVREDGVSVVADVQGRATLFTARRCIVAAEEHTNAVLASTGVQLDLRIDPIVSEHYAADAAAAPRAAPVSMPRTWFHYRRPEEGNHYFGFSGLPWDPPGVTRIDIVSPAGAAGAPDRRTPLDARGAPLGASFVEQHLPAHGRSPVARGAYRETSASDGVFVVGHLPATLPGHRNVAVAVTGWGSGFAPLIGEILRDLAVDGATSRDIGRFALTRPGVLTRCAPAGQDVRRTRPPALGARTGAPAAAPR